MKKILLLAVIALVGTANAQTSASDEANESMHKGNGSTTEANVGKEGCTECNKHRVHVKMQANTVAPSSRSTGSSDKSSGSAGREGAQ
ncbi:hypothetical protein [Bdellovibrio sp. HCB209]|uniref:hypothetical protein n=1 Tax=Bdellovibrio sp. HCB209 TaxID=3394354 RepID=UPI0039B516A1